MKVILLKNNPNLYSCNSYLVLGTWNRIEDVNTLIDIGQDGYIINEIDNSSTGFAKRPIEQVIFTHNHFDHAAGIKAVNDRYHPIMYAYLKFDGVDWPLRDGQMLRLGDRDFEVIYVPGHSDDSILLYCEREQAIFSGDTSLIIRTLDGTYSRHFISVMKRLSKLKIEIIYPGHGDPIYHDVQESIMQSVINIRGDK